MRKISSLSTLRRQTLAWRQAGERIALVPTMGALHDGHLSLVRLAHKRADRVVVSIFVNPTQFAEGEDLTTYPRDEAGDFKKLRAEAVDAVWSPSPETMYADTFATSIKPEGAALGLEGEFRPHHFGGVATVCCKLFNQVMPDAALFGEKDFQQLAVMRQLVRDLDMNLKIVAGKTMRAKDGLALSSRNRYLSTDERALAPVLYATLKAARTDAHELKAVKDTKSAGRQIRAIESKAARALIKAGFGKVDYVACCDAETLGPYQPASQRKGRILAAAWLGKTRLIDNCAV